MHHTFFIHSPVYGYLGCSCFVCCEELYSEHRVHTSRSDPEFISFGFSSWMAGLHGNSILIILRNLHGFLNSCTNFHSQTKGPSLYILANTHYLISLTTAIITGVSRYLPVALICVSMMMNDVDHLFM